MPNAIREAQPPLEFIPPAFRPWVYWGIRALMPAWLRYKLRVTQVDTAHLDRLVDLFAQFQDRQIRFLIAFRHPTTDDPFSMAYLVWHLVGRRARQRGIRLSKPVHSHFVYDRGIPLWAGPIVSWLFPRIGGTPILRGKADRLGLKTIRQLLVDGQFPVSIAPEGATNDQSGVVAPLEPGVAQIGFWGAEDLAKAERPENLVIVPIGIRYSYLQPPWEQFETVLDEMERVSGMDESDTPTGLLPEPRADQLYGRLLALGHHLLDLMADFYKRFEDYQLKPVCDEAGESCPLNLSLSLRLQEHLDNALKVAERRLNVKPQGNFGDRCRRLEQAGWDRIFREDLMELSPLERGLADWMAEEASLNLWHMRLAERLTNITGDYIQDQPTADRFAEILIILWRLMNWVQGKDPQKLPDFGPRQLFLTIGEPLSVTDRLPQYQTNRRAARKAVLDLTQDLQQALEKMLHLCPSAEVQR